MTAAVLQVGHHLLSAVSAANCLSLALALVIPHRASLVLFILKLRLTISRDDLDDRYG